MATKLQIGAANPLTLDDNLLEGFRARVSAGEDANLVSREFFQSAAKEISDAQARVVAAEGRHADGFATPDDLARKYGLNNANELGILKGQATDQDTGVLALAAALRNVAQPTQFVPGSLQSGKPVVQPGTVVPVPTATTVKSDSIKAPPGKFIVLPGGRELHYDYADPTIKAAADAGQYQIRTEPGYVFKQPDQMTTGPKQVPQQGGAAAVIPGGVFGGQPTTTGAPAIQATANIPTIPLQPGARGDAVKQLQDFLVAAGFMTAQQVATGPGIYGPQTTAAVRALQESLGVDNVSGPGYFGPKTIAAVQAALAAGGGQQGGTPTGTEPGTVPGSTVGAPSQGSNLSDILAGLGIQTNPQTSLNDIVTQLSKLYGLDEVNGEMKKLDDEYAENVAGVNDDPWISEGLRVTRIRKLEEKYDQKRSQLLSRLSLQNDVIGQAISLYNTERNFQQENAQIAMQEQQRLIDNQMAERRYQQDERKLLEDSQRVDTAVVERSDGSKVLINAQTGAVIATISGTGTGRSPTPGYNVYGKPLTGEQAKASGYAQRIASANQTFDALGGQFSGVGAMIGQFSPNILQSPERQQFEQAKRNFVNAVLRRESGAAIGESEFNSASKQYFPQPGDSNKVLEQKRQNREQTYQNILVESGQSVPGATQPIAPGTPTVSDFNYVMSLKLK